MDGPNGPKPEVEEQKPDSRTLLQRFERHILGKMLAGFLALVPLLVTAIILLFVIQYVDNFIRPLTFVGGHPWDFPGIGLIAALIAFYSVGLLIATGFGRQAIGWKSAVLTRIPVVKTIFGVTQQATTALTSPSGHSFSRVVFLEWPREGMVAMGLVTGHAHSPEKDESLVVVYIPTVPNPTSGNMAFVSEEDVIETGLTVEDAMKLIFSGGIVLPEALSSVPRINVPDIPSEFPEVSTKESEPTGPAASQTTGSPTSS